MLQIEEPVIAVAAGRPRGRANHAQKDPKIVAAKGAATKKTTKKITTKKITTKKITTKKITTKKVTNQSRSTKRDLSGFEVMRKRTARVGRAGRAGLKG